MIHATRKANTRNNNVSNIMSINVFKQHPGNKITFSDRSIICGELKVVGSRPKAIPGSVGCMGHVFIYCTLHLI